MSVEVVNSPERKLKAINVKSDLSLEILNTDIIISSGKSIKDSSGNTIVSSSGVSSTKKNRITITNAESPYTVLATDNIIMVDASAGAVIVNLQASITAGDGKEIIVKKIDTSANIVTLQANGAELIDDANTKNIIHSYDSIGVVCDALQWWIV